MGQILSKMNRIEKLFKEKHNILSVYFTAGFPELEDTLKIAKGLEQGGADIIEIGMPFSDPIADGPTIQESNNQALHNGMTIRKLFEQLTDLREQIQLPVLLMGYINPVIQFGIKRFCEKCEEVGVDGLILPDLPLAEYEEEYKALFESHGLHNIFLITPQTSEERIRHVDEVSGSFIYMVSTASTTGKTSGFGNDQLEYFKRIEEMDLRSPRLIGFGIHDHETFRASCEAANGAIIGSAFIKHLSKNGADAEGIKKFVKAIKG